MTNARPEPRETFRATHLIKLGELAISCAREGDVEMISPVGELDVATAASLRQELERADTGDACAITVDLSRVTFVSSIGIALLLEAHAHSRAAGDRFSLLRGPAAVQRAFQLSGVDDLLPFADT